MTHSDVTSATYDSSDPSPNRYYPSAKTNVRADDHSARNQPLYHILWRGRFPGAFTGIILDLAILPPKLHDQHRIPI